MSTTAETVVRSSTLSVTSGRLLVHGGCTCVDKVKRAKARLRLTAFVAAGIRVRLPEQDGDHVLCFVILTI